MKMHRAGLAILAIGAAAAAGLQAGFSDFSPRTYTPRAPAPKKPDPERQAAAEAKRQRKAAKRLAAKEQSK